MEFKRILSTTVLTFALMATACGPKSNAPVDKDDGHHSITVTNLADIEAEWMVGGAERTLELDLKEDGVAKPALVEYTTGNLSFQIGDTSIVTNNGFIFSALKVGKTTVAVKYGDSVKVVNITVVEKPAEPQVVQGKTIAQILEDVKTTGDTRVYQLEGTVKNFGTKSEWNQYGELNVEQGDAVAYFYGSYVNTEAEPASFNWDGEKYTYSYTKRNVLEQDMTKDLKKGDSVKLLALYAPQYKNFYGIWVNVTAGPVVAATSVTLNKDELTLEVGSSETLTATIEPENCNQKPTWESSNTAVATVNGGKVVAVAPGTTTITVTVGDKTDTCAVTVERAAANVVKLTPENLLSYAGTNVPYGDGEKEIGSVTFGYIELGCYGNGLQCRTKNNKSTTIWNKGAFAKAIEEISLKPNATSMKNDVADDTDLLKIEFAKSADFANAEEHIVKGYKAGQAVVVTPTMKDATFVRYTHLGGGSHYWTEIDIALAE